eukprot:gnl/TRDRNA2_/TRDRNA2_182164_c0_seq1.p1 gnl/TRDRNA2_/TRDRNA2_182164_c0~~gnl/TRDRNA2_/TRDRNA2_182164_c0_seq1.p1  ORF type:complete len:208 (+),score=25.00 gnl/TRDRNA2_/TRDRNA2_182164_c0_seq1:88-711(+)
MSDEHRQLQELGIMERKAAKRWLFTHIGKPGEEPRDPYDNDDVAPLHDLHRTRSTTRTWHPSMEEEARAGTPVELPRIGSSTVPPSRAHSSRPPSMGGALGNQWWDVGDPDEDAYADRALPSRGLTGRSASCSRLQSRAGRSCASSRRSLREEAQEAVRQEVAAAMKSLPGHDPKGVGQRRLKLEAILGRAGLSSLERARGKSAAAT